MRRFALVVVCWAGAGLLPLHSAHADGMILAPPWAFKMLSEEGQIAVVEVRPDRTVQVDLFIGVLDTSGGSHEICFLLPLQTRPKHFAVVETSEGSFWGSEVGPLDEAYSEVSEQVMGSRMGVEYAAMAGSVVAGPSAFVVLAHRYSESVMMSSLGGGDSLYVHTLRTIETPHSRTDLYDSLAVDQLAALAGLPDLPGQVRKALPAYAGKPFALVRMHTIPGPETQPDGEHLKMDDVSGLHFTFTQEMLEGKGAVYYDYPLGTGQAWSHPIPLTQIYVTGPTDLNIKVEYPGRPLASAWPDIQDAWEVDRSIGFQDKKRQVYAASYEDANPDRDIRIRLLSGGLSPAARDARSRVWRFVAALVGLPLLGLGSWLVGYRVLVHRHPHARQLHWFVSIVKSWAAGSAILLPPWFLAAAVLGWYWSPELGGTRDAGYHSSFLYGMMTPVWTAAIVILVVLALCARHRSFWARSALASLVSAAIYLPVAMLLLAWLGT